MGIAYRQAGKEHQAHAKREVLLCAGALQSPQLLQLSGVGDVEFLKERGVSVLHHLPAVGRNLQDHLQVRVIHRCAKPITTNDDIVITSYSIHYTKLYEYSSDVSRITRSS